MNLKNILDKEKLSIFILCSILLLSACGASDEPQPYEKNGISAEEPEEETSSIEETESSQESEAVSEEDEEWKNYFHVSADGLQGNILGYSLLRFSPDPESHMEYKQDRAYLLDEDVVGKGIYISDYMCETEVFLGNILKDIVLSRGAVGGENRAYFTEYALQQLADTNWESLDKEWEPDLYIYDRYYEMNPVSGGDGYRFKYFFYPNQEEIRKKEMEEETNIVRITLCVDSDGKICEITTDISVEPARFGRIEEGILQTGLFDEDSYGEQIIKNGSPCHEDMVWDFETYFERFMYPDEVYEQENEGLLASGNVCTSAESVADIFLHVVGNRGADVEKYEEWFKYDKYFSNFADADWESLGEDWIVNEEYDCFFIDRISIGWAGFQFYFYPDFQRMGVDTANAVVIDCNVSTNGLIGYSDIDIFPISKEEYQTVRQKQAESRILLVEKGKVLSETTEVAIPVLDRKVEYMPISEFDTDTVAVEHSSRKVKEEVWGFTDAAEIADYIGQKFLKDFDEDNADKGEIYELLKDKDERYSVPYSMYYYIEDGWNADNKYDCYYVKSNEAEGCMHLQYYFYPEQTDGEQTGKTLVFDVYLSEAGIEDIEVSQFWVDYAIMKGYCSMEDLGEMD